jgi:carbamoyltransferase
VPPGRRARIPAACHADGTARVQTVSRAHNPLYHDLITAFEKRSGVPVIINTSFNTRGKPIVCTPRDALECFFTSPLDVLAIGPYVVEKEPR